MSTPPEPSSRPSLEILLRLKRSERPDSEFWEEFDRGMKQKQLAAIVEPKPWWLECSLLVRRLAPLGGIGLAGGAALFAFVALRTEWSSGPSSGPVAEVAGQGSLVSRPAAVNGMSASEKPAVPSRADAEPILSGAPSLALVSTSPHESEGSGRMNETPTFQISHSQAESMPKVGSLAATASVALSQPEANAAMPAVSTALSGPIGSLETEGQFVHSLSGIEVLSMASSEAGPVSPSITDKEMAPFTSPRQARLLAMAEETDAASDSRSLAHVRDRVIHRMSEGEALYASISRLGVSGDRLSVKF